MGWPASRAGTARRSASTPSRWPSTRCWWRRSPPPCSPTSTRRWQLAALLHDAPEYVIGDLISPFKAAIGLDYKAFEVRLLEAIHRRFGLPPVLPERIAAAIKHADRVAAYYEATRLAGFSLEEADRFFGVPRSVPADLQQALESSERAVGRRRPGRIPGAFRRSCGKVNGPSSFRHALHSRTASTDYERGTNAMSNVNVAHSHAPQSLRMDGSIHVCPLSAVPDVVASSSASHLLTCLQDEIVVETPALIKPDRHLRLHVHDIAEPIAGLRRARRASTSTQLHRLRARLGRPGPDGRALLGRHQPLHGRRLHLALRHQSRSARRADRPAPARGLADGLSQPPDDPAGRRRARAAGPHDRSGGVAWGAASSPTRRGPSRCLPIFPARRLKLSSIRCPHLRGRKLPRSRFSALRP